MFTSTGSSVTAPCGHAVLSVRYRTSPRPNHAAKGRVSGDEGTVDSTNAAGRPSSTSRPSTPVQYLRGVGPARAELLGKLGVRTLEDLTRHYPREHQDRSKVVPIAELRPETRATVEGRVAAVRKRRMGGYARRRSLVVVSIEDGSGTLEVEFWQQPWRADQLAPGTDVILAGRVTWDHGPKMSSPEVEVPREEDEPLSAGRIVPVHPVTQGLHPAWMRGVVARALDAVADQLDDPLPESIRSARDLQPLATALRQMHFPESELALSTARRRLEYEELFILQTAIALRRRHLRVEEKPHRVAIDARLDGRIRARFPFPLTGAQDRCCAEIAEDLASGHPMNRLLQGDVGAGKTVVAAYAMLAVVAHKLQCALLAPTEILAEQHHATFSRMLEGSRVRLALLTGSASASERRDHLSALAAGEIDICIGTHALLTGDVQFETLALVIVDEQHKFGVLQRSALRKKGLAPDVLVMSATPIPRTLTMTLFGDLDVSVLDEMPPGRSPVATVLAAEADRERVHDLTRRVVRRGHRVYHVVPLVEESDESNLRAAVQHAQHLRDDVFPEIDVGLLHGRMSGAEKDAAMDRFRAGETPILVCTSVVEVGVDVPEATLLVIEHGERFGLAQLHQLRGRVGRGEHPGRMIVFHDSVTPDALERLNAIASTTDGFVIAEEDLRIRGPGEFLGTRQSGLPELRLASLVGGAALLTDAREDALALVERDPDLTSEGAPVREALRRFLESRRSK